MNLKFINIVSIAVLLVLLVVQSFVVRSIWRTQEENVKLQYHTLATNALNDWDFTHEVGVLDTTFALIDQYSLETVVALAKTTSHEDSVLIIENFTKNTIGIIDHSEYMSTAIYAFFEKLNLSSTVTDRIDVNRLTLIGVNGKDIDLINNPKVKDDNLISINSFVNETSYYKMSLNYAMDVKNKKALIIEQTWSVMLLAVSSFLVVCGLFWFAYRNLMKEKQISEMKTDFINNMTHELKTPLSTIAVITRALELEPIRQDENRVLEKALQIKKQNDQLNGLVNKFLDVSMFEKGDFILEKEPLVLSEAIDHTLKAFEHGQEKDVVIFRHFNASSELVLVDKVYLNIIMNNLLANAMKYCDKVPEIHVSTSNVNGQLRLTITDNGIGIAPADLKHVFNKFYRVRQGDIHKVKGLGLGLFYVQQIVDAHAGHVSITSRVGKGSTFTIALEPLKPEE